MIHLSEERLVEFYYDRQDRVADSHLQVCELCRSEWDAIREALDAFAAAPVPEPDPFFESRVWADVRSEVERVHSFRRFAVWTSTVLLACMLALLAIYGTRRGGGDAGENGALTRALGAHLERAQILLTELEYGRPDPADLQEEQQQARRLLQENRKLRAELRRKHDALRSSVLTDVESVLSPVADGELRKQQKDTVDRDGVIFKIRITRANLQRPI